MTKAPPFMQMDRLSTSLCDLQGSEFDVIVIGSGYGGSIAASRLARAHRKVCLLERGAEILPGEYPMEAAKAAAQTSVISARRGPLPAKSIGPNPMPRQSAGTVPGMMQIRVNEEMHVILGSGLGGGSLINANMSIVPDMRVFDETWPIAFRAGAADSKGNRHNCLEPYYDRARKALGANPLPEHVKPAKLAALEQSAKAMKQPFERPDINVTFKEGPNAFGITQPACTLCGDCCSGCNYGAKNTLLMNYLPDAKRHKASLVTLAEVDHVTRHGAQWAVKVTDLSPDAPQKHKVLHADIVILAAGTLGSTEILFRSQMAPGGPSLSKALGSRFSGNGDVLGFGFGANVEQVTSPQDAGRITPLYSIGAGVNAPIAPPYQPGPCITGVIKVDMTDRHPLHDGLVIEDGTAPGPLAAIYPAMLFVQDVLDADFTDFPDSAIRTAQLKDLGTALQSGTDPAALSYSGVMAQMQSYLLMSHDNSGGRLTFNPDTGYVGVSWDKVGTEAPFPRDNAKLRAASEAIWANFIANPIWSEGFGRQLVSVHPLGGCPMSDSCETGVTDAEGRVYTGKADNSVYETLLVCDGSIIPTSLGVNPLLTISALTERAMSDLIARNNWTEDTSANPVVPLKPGKPYAPPTPPTDWERLASHLNLAAWACTGVAATASLGLAGPVRAELDKLASFLFGSAPQGQVDAFLSEALAKAHLQADIAPAFRKIGEDLLRLHDAIQTARETDAPVPQAFLNAFFALVGDVSSSLAFEEAMQGHVWDKPAAMDHALSDAHQIAEALGKAGNRVLEADFTIYSASTLALGAALPGQGREGQKPGPVGADIVTADLSGRVVLTNAEGQRVSHAVTRGTFQLLQPDLTRIETWLMIYDCLLVPEVVSEPSWKMHGVKTLKKGPGTAWFRQLTTLAVDLETDDPTVANPRQQGIIHLGMQDIAAQLPTITPGFAEAGSLSALKAEVMTRLASGTFTDWLTSPGKLRLAFQNLLIHQQYFGPDTWPGSLAQALQGFFTAGIGAKFANLILRAYGGIVAYSEDYPSQTDGKRHVLPIPGETVIRGSIGREIRLPDKVAPKICLFHYPPPDPSRPMLGPVMLVPGMSTTALSFAALSNERSLVEMLLEQNYDVWLFDYRTSPRVTPTNIDYTMDDVAAVDWPLAVDHVLAHSPLKPANIQVVAHCVGALTAQMALLGGHVEKAKIRQMVLMQFTAKVAPMWFNVVKADIGLAQAISRGLPETALSLLRAEMGGTPNWQAIEDDLRHGLPMVDMTSPPPDKIDPMDQVLNTLCWPAPFGIDEDCLSPTCHRIYASYGPVIAHKNLNQATHDGMRDIFGMVATKPFEQLGLILQKGRIVDHLGRDRYLPHVERLDLPIHIMSGELNQILLPESGYLTLTWLKQSLPKSPNPFTRETLHGYAHNDCIVGKDAWKDIFPQILRKLADPFA